MHNEIQELFLSAARHFYRQYKQGGGSQGKLAEELGITNSYLSSIMSGSRRASLELQSQIADRLFGPYDKFLALGRRIKEGHTPLENEPKKKKLDSVEKVLAQLTHYVIDHQRIEKELLLSQEKYRDISLTSGDMIFEMDENLTFIYLAGRVKEVTGRNPGQILNRHFSEFLDKKETNRLQELVEENIRRKSILDTVLTIREGKETKYRHLIAKPLYDTDGKFSGARGTYRDITKRKNLEKAIEQQNWLLQVALDSIDNNGIVITAADNTVLKWNIAYKRMFNHSDKILKTRDSLEYLQEARGLAADPQQFDRQVHEAMQSRKEISHTFMLLDGKTILRRVIPLYRDGVLVGRITHIRETARGDPVGTDCK